MAENTEPQKEAAPAEEGTAELAPEAAEVVAAEITETVTPDEPPAAPEGETVETAAEDEAVKAAVSAIHDDDDTPWYDRPEVTAATDALPADVQSSHDLEPPAAVEETPAAVADGAATVKQQIFVQAPQPPEKRGNRGFSGIVALIATIIFGVVYLAARLFLGESSVAIDQVPQAAVSALGLFTTWVPVAVFFVSFWLLGAFLNTAKWGLWVILSFLIAVLTYAAVGLGEVLNADIWVINGKEALELMYQSAFSWVGVIAFVAARELPIWLSAWIARRGRSVVAKNDEAQAEYQQLLEEGPKLVTE